MKKVIICLIFAVVALCADAQKEVTKFMGIPVDGSKSEMIRKLKAKGFRIVSSHNGIMEGEFNGMNVNVFIVTNRDKVCRIMVCDVNMVDERSIQIRFNNLCRQFEKNTNYISLGYGNELIPDDEDIAYEMNIKNKQYEAIYYQQPSELSETEILEIVRPKLLNRYSLEELNNPSDAVEFDKNIMVTAYKNELSLKKPVWFKISEVYGQYYLVMYYDNEYNRADGEDL